MSTYRTHRIVVASLFLPHTAVLGDASPTPGRSPSGTAPSTPAKPKGIVEALQDAAVASRTPIATPGLERANPFVPTTPGPDSAASTAVAGFANALANAGSAVASAVAGASASVPTSSNQPILRPKMPGPLKSIVEDLQDKSRNVTPIPTPGVESSNPFSLQQIQGQGQGTAPHHGPSRLTRKSTLAARAMSKSRSMSLSPELPTRQTWHVEPNSAANGGLHNAINSVKDRLKDTLWVGTLGTATDGFEEATRREVDSHMRGEHGSLPVWIPDADFRKFYDEFCHQVLWPALHYAVPDAPKTKSFYESSAWSEYVSVNTRFADAIARTHQEGDILFVNDYHLLLLPQLLRERLPTATIGFFLHVAFPSSEIFRCLSVRARLLRGMLASDLLGFQTANHARHFRQTVSRILSLEATPRGIQTEDRFVDVGVFPMGIDVASITARRNEAEVKEWIETLQQRYAGFKLLVGRDKLDEVQGVKHKLLAFELFLERYPEFRNKVVLIQVALQTSEANEHHAAVGAVVSRINGRFATLTYTPVVFLHTHDLTFSQYLALLTVADAFVVTSVREGMALRAHEFVECQATRKRPLILSEFTGSYTYRGFRSCIAVNPWDKRGTAEAMHQALTMPDSEASSRWDDLHAHVTAQSAQAFIHGFLQRTLRAGMEHLRSGADAGAGAPPKIEVGSVLPRWKHSDRRFVGVDLEGTLWLGRDPRDASARPPAPVVDALRRLSEDGRNALWVFSGLPVAGALEDLGRQIPRAGIVAENGCFVRPPAEEGGGEEGWISMVESKNLDWKGPCLEILNYFTERTPGAYVEERAASVVWRYWTQWDAGAGPAADRAWARRQAAEAQNHIFDSIGERFGLRIVPGANSFLVLPSDVSRAAAFVTILDPGGPVQNPRLRVSYDASGASADAGRKSPRVPRRQSSLRAVRGEEAAFDALLVLSQDERLLRRVGEHEGAETVSVLGANVPLRATEAKWTVSAEESLGVLEGFVGAA